MSMKFCNEQRHYYDDAKYALCPYCNDSVDKGTITSSKEHFSLLDDFINKPTEAVLPKGFTLNNKYEILKVLGMGDLSNIYLAKNIDNMKKVVIEEFYPRNMGVKRSHNCTVLTDLDNTKNLYRKALKNFLEEKEFMLHLNHLNIVGMLEIIKKYNTAFAVMPSEEGKTLDIYLSNISFLKEDELLTIIMPILEGVKYMHSKGILHTHIAPDNIYLREYEMPMLIGVSDEIYKNPLYADITADITIAIPEIKDGYLAPEQYVHIADQNAATDIYALGAVIYRMITGNKLATAVRRQTALLKGEQDPIGDLAANYKGKYSDNLLQAITKALDMQQERRFQTIEEFQYAIFHGVPKMDTVTGKKRWWQF